MCTKHRSKLFIVIWISKTRSEMNKQVYRLWTPSARAHTHVALRYHPQVTENDAPNICIYVCVFVVIKETEQDYSAIESISEWLLGRGFVEYVRLIPWRTSTGDRRRDERLDDVTNGSDWEVVGASNRRRAWESQRERTANNDQSFRCGISNTLWFMFSVN